jgi:hypothetical protein
MVAFVVAFALAATASADPVNAKNVTVLTGICAGQTVQIVTNGNGEFTPGHILGSTAVLVPAAFDLAFTFTPADGSPGDTETDTSSHSNIHGNVIECSLPIELNMFTSPDGTFSVSGIVWARVVATH